MDSNAKTLGRSYLVTGLVLLTIGSLTASPSSAQSEKQACGPNTQIAGVEQSRMGAYLALLDLSFQAYQKGDIASAAELARIFEQTFGRAEEYGGDKALIKTNPKLFQQIDDDQDGYVNPLIDFACGGKMPDDKKLRSSYQRLTDLLRAAEAK